MSSRRKARILAFQALYAWDIAFSPLEDLLGFAWLESEKRESLDEEMRTFSCLMIAGTLENIGIVDAEIKKHLQHWTFERLKRVDLAILRVATYSLLYQRDIPAQITIDEAIEIAKEFGAEDSFKFVNGVLDGIWKTAIAFHDQEIVSAPIASQKPIATLSKGEMQALNHVKQAGSPGA